MNLNEFLQMAVDDCVNARYYPPKKFECKDCGDPTEAWAGDLPDWCADCQQNDGKGMVQEGGKR